ncbi:MAG: hypothetical protein IJD22_03590, partial [Clostridia bacterium]|nr:hypothetical protein [Clostridia bacterium]
MKIKNTVKRLLSRAAGVVTALAGWAIYAQASEKAAEGAVAVTGGAMVLTLAFSVLCGFFVFLLLDAPSSPAAEEDMSEAEYDEPSSAESEGSV